MARQRNELHAKQVEAWKKKYADLTSSELTQLFMKAIQAIRQRSLVTLSGITVTIVIDRTLLECKEKFPILSEITSDSNGFHFDKFMDQIQNSKTEEHLGALQELLIELLDVFGKITADILTKYLYQELMTVTNETKMETAIENSDPLPKRTLGLVKNREKK